MKSLRMRSLRILLALIFLLCLVGIVMAQEPGVEEIIRKANDASYYAGSDGRSDVRMTITDGAGGVRVREFSILRLNVEGADQKFYVYFKAPADVRKMAFLVWKHLEKDDDRWLWLPALNLKKRIAPGDKRTSFVGSDFFYEDISGRGTEEDFHELIGTDEDRYRIKCVPKDPASVEFAWYEVSIDRKDFLPRLTEYYDRQGRLYRRVEAVRVETIGGHPTVVESVASDLLAGSSTKNEFTDVLYELGLKERLFTERFLRRPPREVTR